VRALAESNEAERTALEIVQAAHETSVARDIALAQYQQKERDMGNQFAKEFVAEQDANDADQISPTTYENL
jgi:hypothetical protein